MRLTLCGSTRWMPLWHGVNTLLTLEGHVCYTVATSVHGDWTPTTDQKTLLDLVHLAKIDNSDAIFVLDLHHYVGESTRRELTWAHIKGKTIHRLSEVATGSLTHAGKLFHSPSEVYPALRRMWDETSRAYPNPNGG